MGTAKKGGRKPIDVEKVRELAAKGMADSLIASEVSCSRNWVQKVRKKYHIPAIAGTARIIPKEMVQQMIAARYGLPPWVTGTQRRILLALLDGPKTKHQLLTNMGRYSRGWGRRVVRKGSHNETICVFRQLTEQNMVASYKSYTPGLGSAKGRLPNLYMLTMKALNMLADAGKEKTDAR